MVKRIDSIRIDITDQKFGELHVIKLSDQRDKYNTLLWECRCICEKMIYVSGASLRAGHYKSCGCKRIEKRDTGARDHQQRDSVDGTRKSSLKAKLHKDNKSGHKGVTWVESRQQWRAYIGFKGKSITLGYRAKKEDAIALRLEAEEKYHKPYLEGEELL